MPEYYGLEWPEITRLECELICFRDGHTRERGGLGRYMHFKNCCNIIWKDLKWHDWMAWGLKNLCEHNTNIWTGAAACVLGETRLPNPITGESPTIQELCDNKMRPIVQTLHGPIKASVPFLKGRASLYEVVLDNGHGFTATATHRVLSPTGFVSVANLRAGDALLSYDEIHPRSILEPGLSVPQRDASHCSEISQDCSVDYHHEPRSYGERLLPVLRNGPNASPSLVDALVPSNENSYMDGLASKRERIPTYQSFCLPSNSGSSPRHNSADTPVRLPLEAGTLLPFPYWFQQSWQFHSMNGWSSPFVEQYPYLPRKHSFDGEPRLRHPNWDNPYRGMVPQTRVVSITKVGVDNFYDLTVPVAHHYFAEGAIHHNSGKTYMMALYGFVFWMADPMHTSVILTSTTGKMVRKRIWPVIQELYTSAPNIGIGNLVDSKTTLQSVKGDDKHGIFAIAIRDGSVSRAVADIQGLHSDRMFIDVDEATDTPEAILEAIPNLRKGCRDFRFGMTANAGKHLDPHGRASEPKEGWNSISVDSDEWETKGVAEWEIDPGVALHFDGTKSPNIRCGEDRWPFLFTNSDLKRAMDTPGANESLGFWKFTRGFWAPEGVLRTIMSEGLIEKHNGMGRFVFFSSARKIAGFDPAFGGDNCVLRIGRLGDLADGRLAVQLDKSFNIVVKANKNNRQVVYDQIVNQVVPILESEGVPPEAFGLDATGQGGILASAFVREWSSNFVMVEFGGAASDTPASEDEPVGEDGPRLANDIYDRRVTELWFAAQNFLVNGQLRGLNAVECTQFCNREFQNIKRKMRLDEKDEYKLKNGRSPDEADAVVVLLEVAKKLGAVAYGGGPNSLSQNWLEIARSKDSINVNEPEEEFKGDQDPFALADF